MSTAMIPKGYGAEVGFTFYSMLNPDKSKFLHQTAERAGHVAGEFWDIGCNAGGSSALMKIAAPRKLVRMFDSFEGLPAATLEDKNNEPGRFAAKQDENLWVLGIVYSGWIPDTFAGLENSRIALAHVDLDLYQGTKDALQFVIPRIVPNGKIIVDDYGADGWNGVKTAVDELIDERFSREILTPEQIILTRLPA